MKTNGNDSAFNKGTLTPNGYSPFEDTQPLTKREYFAGLAMQGFAAAPDTGNATVEGIMKYSVKWADALINALNEEAK